MHSVQPRTCFRSLVITFLFPALLVMARADDIGSGSDTGEGSGTGGGMDTGSGTGSGVTSEYSTGNHNLGGGTVTMATAILNGGTVSNGTLDVSTQIDGRSGSISAQLSGTAELVKTTPGVLALSGSNTFTNSVNIMAGTLLVNGSIGPGGTFLVSNGGTLAGAGSISKPVTVSAGGILAPGNSPGTLTFNNGLELFADSVLRFEIGSISDSLLITAGTLKGPLSGSVTVNLLDYDGALPGTYTLIDASNAQLTSIGGSTFAVGSQPSGWSSGLSFEGGKLLLNLTAIPEPGASAVVGAGSAVAVALLSRRRRRRVRSGA